MSNDFWSAATPDLYDYYNVGKTDSTVYKAATVRADSSEANNTLSFEDMLLLMVTQLQNQTIDNTADTSDMMNQIIQMTVMQAITEMSTQVQDLTEANIMSYSASLVGQTVTMALVNSKGELVGERVGEITATGTYNGQRVVYMGDEYYPLNQILAVGRLPDDRTQAGGTVDGTDGTERDDNTEAGGAVAEPEETGGKTESDSGMDAPEQTVSEALG